MKNRTNNSINRAKVRHHKELLFENMSKPEKSWKHIKALFPTKSISKWQKSFVIDNHQTTNENEIANSFCLVFHTAVKKSQSKLYEIKRLCMVTSEKTTDQYCTLVTFSLCFSTRSHTHTEGG